MINYFNIDHAKKEHDLIISEFGGLSGFKNEGLLDSALEFIKVDDYYPDFERKLTHLVFSIAESHPFLDGNKRTSIALGAYFLQINDYTTYVIGNFINYMEHLIIMTIQQIITKDDLCTFITLIINDLPFTDDLSLQYINGLATIEENEKNFK